MSTEFGACLSVGKSGKGEVEVDEAMELVILGASMVLQMERGAAPGTRGVDLSLTCGALPEGVCPCCLRAGGGGSTEPVESKSSPMGNGFPNGRCGR